MRLEARQDRESIMSPAYYREQAQRCRRLAEDIADDNARTTLLELAEEYEHRADVEEGKAD